MKYVERINHYGNVEHLAVRDGVREFYECERPTAQRMNEVLLLAHRAKHIFWVSIALSSVNIIILILFILMNS